jgi:hypothetical protein
MQNIPIPLTPEQRRTACLLREAVLRAAYPGWELKKKALELIDYSTLERRVLANMRSSPSGDVGPAE